IEDTMTVPSAEITTAVAPTSPSAQMAWIVAAVAVLGAVITVAAVWNLRPVPDTSITRFSYVLPEGQALTAGNRYGIAISPDGRNIAYVANNQLYIRSMVDVEARPVPGTAQSINTPFFSPDGLWVGFYVFPEAKLKKVAITGGAAIT